MMEIADGDPFQTEPHVQEGSVSVSSVSPYLLQPIRSLDEARKEIEAKRSADRDSKEFFASPPVPTGLGVSP